MQLTLRPARADDHPTFAELFLHLGVPEAPPSRSVFVDSLMATTCVLCRGGEVVGYAHWALYGDLGHLRNIVVDPAMRGRGCGALLMAHVREQVRTSGASRWYLNVKVDNLVAQRLYTREGFAGTMRVWVMRVPWSVVDRLPDPGGHWHIGALDPSQDLQAAALGDLKPERLAQARAAAGEVLLAVHEGAEVRGVAVYVPDRGGAHPTRVVHPRWLGPLLRACRPHATDDKDLVVPVEGDAASAEALRAAGASLVFDLLQMEQRL